MLFLLPDIITARHTIADALYPHIKGVDDPTVDTVPTAGMQSPFDTRTVWAAMRSPTTQLVSFSPDRMALSTTKMSRVWNGNPYNRSLLSMELRQRACALPWGKPYDACYTAPFDTKMPSSKDKAHVFYRQVGTAGFRDKDLSVFAGRFGFDSTDALAKSYGWGNDADAEDKCNNHRSVSASNAIPYISAYTTSVDWNQIFYNDAEHAEPILGLETGSCRWKPQLAEFFQEVTPIPEQLHPDNLGIWGSTWPVVGQWDHSIEVCSYEGDCTPDDFTCINNFQIAIMSSDDLDAGGPANVLFRENSQFLTRGGGDLPSLRATPTTGPHEPCPVGADGRQIPCTLVRDGEVPAGFVEPEPVTFFVDEIKVDKLKHVGEADFTLRLSYHILWSDRFAVHPCKISLYDYGGGVPKSGKKVDASKWWLPSPDRSSAMRVQYTHSKNLSVYHSPDEQVITTCYVDSCPWPKQLFLREKIKIELQESASWDLFKFPFDKQILRARLGLLDFDEFSTEDSYTNAIINATLPEAGAFDSEFDDIYMPDDW